MGWFTDLTGFAEGSYEGTKARLSVRNGRLYSAASEKSYSVGTLELPSLSQLRVGQPGESGAGRLRLNLIEADVRELHRVPDNAGALFQVASQFNMLEMTAPSVTPEDGVTRYAWDNTQGPVCAIAAGAATIYRNYFVPIGDKTGQTVNRQIDALADMGKALSLLTGLPVHALWNMENGYALALPEGLKAISDVLASQSATGVDELRGCLHVGFHRNVEVTDNPVAAEHLVSQVFCSALPLGYSSLSAAAWEPFARLILEAAYEATLHCAKLNAARTGSNKVFLTLLGGGAFGNPRSWVLDALMRALMLFRDSDLEVFTVSYGTTPKDLHAFAANFSARMYGEDSGRVT